jgi:hypothetical protein
MTMWDAMKVVAMAVVSGLLIGFVLGRWLWFPNKEGKVQKKEGFPNSDGFGGLL